MKIWLDDIRPPPDNTWLWCKNAADALYEIVVNEIDEISFDHDLGNDVDGTGYSVAIEIESRCHDLQMTCPKWSVHSANPVGKMNIVSAMRNAEKFSGLN